MADLTFKQSIELLRNNKSKLEENIVSLINKFQEDTGVRIKKAELNVIDDGVFSLAQCTIELEL